MEDTIKGNAPLRGAIAKQPRKITHRRNLYLTDELFQSIEAAAADMGYGSSTDLIQASLRMIVLGHKYYLSEDHGLYWKNGDRFDKVFLGVMPLSF